MNGSVLKSVSSEMLEYVFHHLFLPSKLPEGDDSSPTNELSLVKLVQNSLTEFLSKTDPSNHAAITSAKALVESMHTATGLDGFLQEDGIKTVLKKINPHSMFLCFP
jgi:hypothetical protein